jgi:ketosteroid isomerase-like protein
MNRLLAVAAALGMGSSSLVGRAPHLFSVASRAASEASAGSVADTIIALERSALERWGRGDPQGYVETFAPEITYFDPFTEKRIDGIYAMKAALAPITGKVRIDRYEMLNPRVQHAGDVAVLSFNLVSHARNPDGSPRLVRWNSTEVYRRFGGKWRIVHNHWSFTKPELKQAGSP